MSTQTIRIAHLFPELLNLYADQGNLAVLTARARARGIEVKVVPIKLREPIDYRQVDLIMLGGGSDREQRVVSEALASYAPDLRHAIEDGFPFLAVCGGYQLLGHSYELTSGEVLPGLQALDLVTKAGTSRLIGNIAIELPATLKLARSTVVGFENHIGRTEHAHQALGRVLAGHGNNGVDHAEGIFLKRVIGTYIHGPLLPKNPHLADLLLSYALAYRGDERTLEPLDDTMEWLAHDQMLARLNVARKERLEEGE